MTIWTWQKERERCGEGERFQVRVESEVGAQWMIDELLIGCLESHPSTHGPSWLEVMSETHELRLNSLGLWFTAMSQTASRRAVTAEWMDKTCKPMHNKHNHANENKVGLRKFSLKWLYNSKRKFEYARHLKTLFNIVEERFKKLLNFDVSAV